MSDLTIFVIQSGKNPNFFDCIDALSKQTITAEINIIKDYTPLSRAFQEMIIRCKTKYYVQVDEDMILYPGAIEALYLTIKNASPKTYMISYMLLDTHLSVDIFGIKIYNHSITKNYPYNLDVISCECEQMERFNKDSYTSQLEWITIGRHSPKWTKQLIFDRYFDLMEKWKKYHYYWVNDVPNMVMNKCKQDPSEINLYALSGVLSSLNTTDIHNEEKNICHHNKYLGNLESFLMYPNQATLFLTDRCNFKCNFCWRNNQAIEKAPDIDVNTCKQLFIRFPSIKNVAVAGFGEPLLSPNLGLVIEYVQSTGRGVGLITNGSLVKKKIQTILNNPPMYVSVSLNSVDEQSHSKVTNTTGHWMDILEGLYLLQSSGILTYVSYICTKQNIRDLPNLFSLIAGIGKIQIVLHNLLPHWELDKQGLAKFLYSVLTVDDQKELDKYAGDPNASLVSKWPILIDPKKPLVNCRYAWNQISVNGNRSFSICNSIFSPNKNNGSLDDINIWHNDYCNKFRESFSGVLPLACQYCFRNWENV